MVVGNYPTGSTLRTDLPLPLALPQSKDPAPASSGSLSREPRDATELYPLLIASVVDYAIFALDPTGRVLSWNAGAQRLKGWKSEEIIGRHFSTFYTPEDKQSGLPAHALAEAARVGRFENEGWRVRKDGTRFWANVVLTALRDTEGKLVGYAKVTRDLTTRRAAEEQARRLAAESAAREAAERRGEELAIMSEQLQLQAAELEAQTEEAQSLTEELESANEQLRIALDQTEAAEQFSRGILESISDPFVVQDAGWRFRYVNEAARRAFADTFPGGDVLGQVVWDAFPALVGSRFETEMRRAAEQRTPVTFEAFYPERGEWTQMFCYPLADGGLASQWKNITARKQAEEAAHYLARASDVLASSLDYEATLSELARIVVPELADWCAVHVVDEDGVVRQLAVAHVDPSKVEYARQLNERYPPHPEAPTGALHVIRTGRSELYPEIPDAMLAASARDEEHLRLSRALGLRSAMVVPLSARGRSIGALTLVTAESRRRYGEGDLALAQELGRRAGIAVDNARLLAESRAAAERTERLQAVTAGLARQLSVEEVADTVMSEGLAALGAVNGTLCLFTEDGLQLEIVRAIGISDAVVRAFARMPIDSPLPIAEAVRTGEPVALESREELVRRYPALREANAGAATRAWLAVPLMLGARALGALALGFPAQRTFRERDRELAMALGRQAAQALERARLYAAERAARNAAEEANRAKSQFLATMSHELRTPLNAIAGYAELLEIGVHGTLNEEQREAVARVQRSQRHLLALINDILNFARIEAGHLALEPSDVRVRDALTALEPLIAPQLGAKSLRLAIEPADDQLVVHADPEKVQQILLNLASNAIKFTAPGGRLDVRAAADGDVVRIEVSDTGVGIPADRLEHIFEPFVQLERSLTNPHEGAGLGLAISRDLARAMGGDLMVRSQVGTGSTFTLTLPRAGGGAR